jgi:hypothetical protein
MSAGCAKEGDPDCPCHAQRQDEKECAQCSETGLLDVKMTSYERSYPRFNQRRSCMTAAALQPPRKESAKNGSIYANAVDVPDI